MNRGYYVTPASFRILCLFSLLCLSSLVGCQQEQELGSGKEHYLAALDALGKGDTQTAISELSLSIEAEPDVWAYLERARIYSELGEDEKAKQDLVEAKKIDSANTRIGWIEGELRKAKDARYKGRLANPPQGGK
ncbi:MAG: hypothetical protein KDA87_02535 [Planctomycetales bacterium]|nr:hypothetical protein [Planctomycetales bacterium]